MNYYAWFSEALQKEFETQELLKESERSTVSLIRHRASGQPFHSAVLYGKRGSLQKAFRL